MKVRLQLISAATNVTLNTVQRSNATQPSLFTCTPFRKDSRAILALQAEGTAGTIASSDVDYVTSTAASLLQDSATFPG